LCSIAGPLDVPSHAASEATSFPDVSSLRSKGRPGHQPRDHDGSDDRQARSAPNAIAQRVERCVAHHMNRAARSVQNATVARIKMPCATFMR
jgi:hypothetical protein